MLAAIINTCILYYMKNLILFIVPFLASCDAGQPSKKKTVTIDTVSQILSTSDQSIRTSGFNKTVKDKKEILGVWASDNKEPLTVEINKDSIYYKEHFESHKYNLKGDSIFIKYSDFMLAAKIYFTKDTLIMESAGGKVKYYRFKD